MIRSTIATFAASSVLLFAAPLFAQQTDSPSHDVPTTPAKPQTPQVPKTPQVPQTPESPADMDVRARVIFLLSGFEYFPTRAHLDEVASAEEVSAVLRSLATDPAGRPTQRLRAVDALGYYDDAETVALLTSYVGGLPTDGLTRHQLRTANLLQHHAITSLAKSQRGESVGTLEPILAGDDLQLTLTAVHALAKHGQKAGLAALKSLRDNTSDLRLKREIAKWVD